MSIKGSPEGAASPRTRSSDSIPAPTLPASLRVSRDPLPATLTSAASLQRGVRYVKEGSDGSLALSRLDDRRVEVTLDRGGKTQTYILDLSKPDARQAYQDLAKLRTTRAELLAAKPARSGVEKTAAPTTAPATAQPQAKAQASSATTTPATTPEPAKKPSVSVKGGAKPKWEKNDKGLEANATVTAQSGQTKLEAKVNGKVERATTEADGKKTRTDTVNVGGSATVTSGNVVASGGAKSERTSSKTTDAKGNVVATSKQQTVTLDQSVRVTGKNPKDTAGVTAKEVLGTKVDTDANGAKTVSTNRSVDVAADASGQSQIGKEQNLDWSASINVHDASARVTTPDGKTSGTDEKSVAVKGSVQVADTTGPDQSSVKVTAGASTSTKVEIAGDGKKTTTTNEADDASVSASVQRTSGETVISASGNASRSDARTTVIGPDGKPQVSGTTKTAADGTVTVADKTGPEQGSISVNASGSRTVTTKPDGSQAWSNAGSAGVTAGGSVTDGKTTIGAKVQVKGSETSTGDEKGVKEQKGTLSGQVDLTTSFQGGRKVGFSGGESRDYTLTLPASAAKAPALPLDAASAKALPQGTLFQLTGKGTLGITGEADGFKAGVSDERTLGIKVDRGAGDQVTATVDFGSKATNTEGFEKVLGDPKKLNAKLSASNSGTAAKGRTDQFTFDLSNPAHQQAYDALLRGDLSQAQALGIGKTLKQAESSGNEQKLGGGIAFGKIGASVELSRKDLDPSDERIQGDPDRKAITEAARKDGKDVRWIERGGAWELGGGYDYGASPGVAGFGFGFEAKKGMEWRSLGPKVDGEGGAPGVAMSADDAEKMPAGSEFSVRGTSKVSGRASVIGGWQVGGGGVTVSAGVGFDVSKGKTTDLSVRVKKLPDGKVEVRMDELKSDKTSAAFSAKLGATVNGAELAAAGGSVLGALAKNPDLANKLSGLQKSLSIEFKAGKSTVEEEGKGLVFTLDLNQPDARAAYEKLVRGNPEQALDASGQDGRGVQLRTKSELSSKEKDREIGLRVGNTELFAASDKRKDLTVEAVTDGKTERLDQSVADRMRSSVFGRRRQLTFDAVSVRTERAPTGEKFLRLSYTENDKYTSREELSERRALAKSLGAVPVKEERIQEEHGGGFMRWVSGSHNDHGKVTTNIEAFVTSTGIAKIRGAGREQQLSAYGEAIKDMHDRTPAWNDPKTSTRARELLEGYRHASEEDRGGFRSQYEQEFGKKAFQADVKDYARASEFADALAKSSDDANPAAWNRTFADLAQKMGFSFFDSLSAMNKLAGGDEVVVGKFEMKGKSVDIEMKSEGTVTRPQLSGGTPATADAACAAAKK